MRYLLISTLALTSLACVSTQAQPPRERLRERLAPPPTETLYSATAVLTELSEIPAKGIPARLLADAQGVAVIPRVVKAGFVVAGSGGRCPVPPPGQGRCSGPARVSYFSGRSRAGSSGGRRS